MRLIIEARLEGYDIERTVVPIPLGRVNSHGFARSPSRLKVEFGGNHLRVKGGAKVMGHLMFGVLALSADQLMRLRQ